MPSDFIPNNHDEYLTKLSQFEAWLVTNGAGFGFAAGEITAVTTAKTTVSGKLAAKKAADTASLAANGDLQNAETAATALWRSAARRLQAAPNITDADRIAAGLTVPSGVSTPVAVPTTAPVGRIEQLNRLQHTIHFADATTPASKAKPAGVRGCQIWVKVGTAPPANASELHYLATDTRTPYVAQFESADSGKTAYYWLRWENTKGETGPWSAMISATITG